jgi:hypothetical protein
MAAINVTQETHAQIRHLSRKLLADNVETTIGDVGDHLWDFVRTKHADEFEAYVRESIASK